MSTYVTIYAQKESNIDGRIPLISWLSGSNIYPYLYDLARGDEHQLTMGDIESIIHEIESNLHKLERQNELLKQLGTNGMFERDEEGGQYTCPIDKIMENEDLIKDGREVIGELRFISHLIDDADWTSIEYFVTLD